MIRALAFIALAFATPAFAADVPPVRVVFFGDSITKQGFGDLVAKALGVDAINAGVGGNNTVQGLKRIKADVLDKKPAVVVILFGTNDCRPADESAHVPVEQYQKNLISMIEQSQAAGAKVAVCTLPPINPEPYFQRHKREKIDAAGGLDKVIASYRAAAIAAADEKKAVLIDLNQTLAKEKQADWLSADGVHPSPRGKELIAAKVAETIKPLVGRSTNAATAPAH